MGKFHHKSTFLKRVEIIIMVQLIRIKNILVFCLHRLVQNVILYYKTLKINNLFYDTNYKYLSKYLKN